VATLTFAPFDVNIPEAGGADLEAGKVPRDEGDAIELAKT
jgi:hypothetical protein